MKNLQPKDIDDDLLMHFDNTGGDPTDWEEVTFFDEETDLAVVSVDGVYGAVNRKGETVIPIIYDYAMIRFSESLLAVKKNNKWGYVDYHHKIVIPFEYDNISDYKFEDEKLWMKNNSVLGTVDYFSGDNAFVCKDGKIGIINKRNEIVFPFIYQDISSYNEKYLCVSYDKLKYGVVDFNNNTVLPFEYDFLHTNEAFLNFAEISDKDGSKIDTSVNFYKVKEGKLLMHGIMDSKGDIVIPPISSVSINNFIEGKAMCFDYEKQEFFIFDSISKEIIYAPEDLKENESETAKVNFIRHLMGMAPVYYPIFFK